MNETLNAEARRGSERDVPDTMHMQATASPSSHDRQVPVGSNIPNCLGCMRHWANVTFDTVISSASKRAQLDFSGG